MAGANQRAVQRALAGLAMAIGFRLQLLDGFAHFEWSRRGRHRLAEAHGDWVGNEARKLPEEAAALEAENAAPDAVEIHRDDRRVHALHDALHAAAEGKQLADACDLPLGEDADHFAALDCVGGFAKRLQHFARPQFGGNRYGANHLRERLYVRQIVDALEHQKADGPVGGRDQQKRVNERHVVRDEKRAARFGDVFAPLDANAVQRSASPPRERSAAANPAAGKSSKSW